jgi:hypothetical protein
VANPVLLQDSFALGMKQDGPREQLPKGVVWNMTDWIPEFGAPLVKRGGYSRPFNTLTTGSYMTGVGFAAFAAGAQVLMINDAGTLFTALPGGAAVTSRGAAVVPAHPPTYYRATSFICDINGAAVPKTWDGGSLANLGGSPPPGSVSCAYKDHLVLGGSAANRNRIWFSSAGNPAAWATGASGQWLDITNPVYGMAALRNMIVCFSEGNTERIVGDIIPGISGSDFRVEPMHPTGCADPASIATDADFVVYANADGVYMTDGVALADITAEGGIKMLWQSLLATYSSAWTIAATIHRGRYIVSVMNGSTFICAFMCEVKRRVWTRLTNVKSLMMVSSPVGIPNAPSSVYMADRSSLFAGNLATMFTPSGTYKNDGDGTAVLPVLETGYFYGKQGRKRFRRIYVGWYMTDAASDNPILTASYARDLATGAYTALSETLAENVVRTRQRIDVGIASEGIAVKLAQSNASAVTNIYSIEAEMLSSERSRS